ncbi:hypothetical protein D3C83_309220 [compost metagenome]
MQHRGRIRDRYGFDQVNENLPREALNREEFRPSHVLDLLGHVFQVEFVRKIAARPRQIAQRGRLPF